MSSQRLCLPSLPRGEPRFVRRRSRELASVTLRCWRVDPTPGADEGCGERAFTRHVILPLVVTSGTGAQPSQGAAVWTILRSERRHGRTPPRSAAPQRGRARRYPRAGHGVAAARRATALGSVCKTGPSPAKSRESCKARGRRRAVARRGRATPQDDADLRRGDGRICKQTLEHPPRTRPRRRPAPPAPEARARVPPRSALPHGGCLPRHARHDRGVRPGRLAGEARRRSPPARLPRRSSSPGSRTGTAPAGGSPSVNPEED